MSVIPALRRLRQEARELEASPSYIMREEKRERGMEGGKEAGYILPNKCFYK
jgi:hypothetical protein